MDEIKGCPEWEVECPSCHDSNSGCGKIPKFCPYCGHKVEIISLDFNKNCPDLKDCYEKYDRLPK